MTIMFITYLQGETISLTDEMYDDINQRDILVNMLKKLTPLSHLHSKYEATTSVC